MPITKETILKMAKAHRKCLVTILSKVETSIQLIEDNDFDEAKVYLEDSSNMIEELAMKIPNIRNNRERSNA